MLNPFYVHLENVLTMSFPSFLHHPALNRLSKLCNQVIKLQIMTKTSQEYCKCTQYQVEDLIEQLDKKNRQDDVLALASTKKWMQQKTGLNHQK